MAIDMFLKLDGIKGESADHKHKDTIDILSWSWGGQQTGSTHHGSGSGSGKVSFQDISIHKFVDAGTAPLWKHLADGKHIPKGEVIIRKAGEHALEYFVMKLENIIISHASTGGSHGEERLTEHVSLNFGKFKMIYKTQKADGSGGAPIEMGWDIPANKPF